MSGARGFRDRLSGLMPHLNERQLRLAAALEARSLGYGGVSALAQATGSSRGTIHRALEELQRPQAMSAREQIRASGGGRKRIVTQNPRVLRQLKELVETSTRGDPLSPLLWTCQSTHQLAEALSNEEHAISADTVGRLLAEMGYSLQANMKTLEEGANHPDRDRQFQYLNERVRRFLKQGEPVISVDTKKKELIGQYYNKGRRWWPGGGPEKVKVHDFIDPDEPKAIPYGVYDVARNQGWVSDVTMTPPALPWGTFAAGGAPWGAKNIRRRGSCSSVPMAVEAMGTACGSGKWSCRRWWTKLVSG